MTNKEIYRKTLTFSLRKLVVDFFGLVVVGGLATLGFFLMNKQDDENGLIGLIIGLIVGLILVAILTHFFGYMFKAGQIAMMTRGVTENRLPDNVYQEGKAAVKARFKTVAVFYLVTNAIHGIFNAIARGVTKIGKAVGGDTGENIASAINSAIQIVVGFLCDCCLGWVFFRKDQKVFKATCEGAALFFKHGKTLIKNVGRIFGLGLLFLILIGGAFFGVLYVVFLQFPKTFEILAAEIQQFGATLSEGKLPEFLYDPKTLTIAAAAVVALILWSFIHSTFIRPFILVGVLRNYMETGMKDIPTEDSFKALDGMSPKFEKLRAADV